MEKRQGKRAGEACSCCCLDEVKKKRCVSTSVVWQCRDTDYALGDFMARRIYLTGKNVLVAFFNGTALLASSGHIASLIFMTSSTSEKC